MPVSQKTNNSLVLMASWIDDNLLVGSDEVVAKTKNKLMGILYCKDCGKLNEYVGCKITRKGKHSLKFTQPVLIQSLPDKFELPNGRYTTPAMAGNVLNRCKEEDIMEAQQQTIYRSGTGKLMHMMHYSRPELYNCVRNQARHMGHAGKKHMKAILRCMKYIVDRPNRGLVLQPDVLWDGDPKTKFIVAGRSNYDYAKESITCRSVSGGRVMLNDTPVGFRSSA